MTISVLMTTYNGEKYIKKQLESIQIQSYQPQEVLIFDDGSTDNTIKIIEEFINKYGNNNIYVLKINEKNLGFNKNFMMNSKLCKGEIVVFSDQDDIWKINKLEEINRLFEKRKEVKAVATRYVFIDKNDKKNGFIKSLFKRRTSGFISVNESLRNNYSTGMSLAVKNDFLFEIREDIMKHNIAFDTNIIPMASIEYASYYISKVLTYRRIHPANVSKASAALFNRVFDIERNKKALESIMLNLNFLLNKYKSRDENVTIKLNKINNEYSNIYAYLNGISRFDIKSVSWLLNTKLNTKLVFSCILSRVFKRR